MADEIQNVYKYIDQDLDRDILISNLNHNVQNYVNSRGWDQGRIDEFYNALDQYMDAINEGRISSTRAGGLYDSAGILDNGTANWRDASGNVISGDDYEAMRRRQQRKLTNDFYANREVASYINSIARGIYNKMQGDSDVKKAAAFDLVKNGVWSGFLDSLSAGNGGNFDVDAWLDLDPYNEETGSRATTERAKALSQYINDYIDSLDENLDFKGSTFGSRDAYIRKLKDLQLELSMNGVDAADFRLLSALGANPDQYRAFFTTERTYTPVDNSPEAVAARKKAEEEKKVKEEKNALANQIMDMYRTANYQMYGNGSAPVGLTYQPGKGTDPTTAYMNALNAANVSMDLSRLKTTNGQEYLPYLEQYGTVLPSAVKEVTMGNYAGWFYIPGTQNGRDYSVLAYNPVTHQVGRLPYWALGPEERQEFADYIESLYGFNTSQNQPLFAQEGGVMPEATPITAEEFSRMQKEQSMRTKADPKLRRMGAGENAYDSGSDGFTNADIARLGAIGADIAAMLSPIPQVAFGAGLASTAAMAYADAKEGYGVGKILTNAAINAGFSALSLIPIFGNAAKEGKVVKTLVNLAPKIGKVLAISGVLATVANGDEILKSLSKIGKDGPENEMNARDWRNVLVCLQLCLSGRNALKSAQAVKQVRGAGTDPKFRTVRVVDKETGDVKHLFFGNKTNDVMKELDAAKTPQEVNDVIHRYAEYAKKYDVDVAPDTKFDGKWWKPWTWGKRASVEGHLTDQVGEAFSPTWVRSAASEGRLPSMNSRARYIIGNDQYLNKYGPELVNKADWKEGTAMMVNGTPKYTNAEVVAAREAAAATEAARTSTPAGTATSSTPAATVPSRTAQRASASEITKVALPSTKKAISKKVSKMNNRQLIEQARADYGNLTQKQRLERAAKGDYGDAFRRLLELRAQANPGMSKQNIIRDLIGRGFFERGGQLNYYQGGGNVKKKTTEQIIRQMRMSFT